MGQVRICGSQGGQPPWRPGLRRGKDEAMRRARRAKSLAHSELAALLLGTGTRQLVENAPSDEYWGCGRTGSGKNRLGFLLMELRETLKAEADQNPPPGEGVKS